MLAAVLNGFDGPTSVTVAEREEPSAGEDQLLLEVSAAAVGPWDVQSTTGAFVALGGTSEFPQIPGWDFSGVVLEVGSAVSGWQVGDRAFGFSPQPWSGVGVFAERVALPAALLTPMPEQLDPITAATLPVAALTAQLAVDQAQISAGSSVLVIGAVGAVGGFVTQLARSNGARVIASVSESDRERALSLGAAVCVERDGDVAEQTLDAVGSVDSLIDLVGPAARPSAIGALRPGGRFVTSIPGPLPKLPREASGEILAVQPNDEALQKIAAGVARGDILARIGETLALSDVREAYRLSSTAGGAKTVLRP
jgi:NADPH:quinone reductase-like Zn-dependent oxidoreductase